MNKKTAILSIAFIAMVSTAFAQQNLLKKEYFDRGIHVGDTIIFCYDKSRNIEPTVCDGYYCDGFFYTNNRYDIKDKRKKHPILVYGGTSENEYTPSSTIANKKMVVLSISDGQIQYKITGGIHVRYKIILLLNTYDRDTIRFFESDYVLKKTKNPYDYINLCNIGSLSSEIIKPNLYVRVHGRDTLNYDYRILSIDNHRVEHRTIYDTWTEYVYFKKITIMDVAVSYKYRFSSNPHITLSYTRSDDSVCIKEVSYDKQYDHWWVNSNLSSGIYVYTDNDLASKELHEKSKIDSINTVILQGKRNAGDYHFELTKVEKPKNQNVRKGKIANSAIYEDNIISIKWNALEYDMRFDFMLKNMTNSTMKLLWDEAIIVNFDGFTERILHKGADIEALQKSQQPAIIPALAQLSDFFCSEKYYGGKRLMGGYGGYNNGGVNDGKEMRLMLPVQVGSTTYTYIFTFTLKWEWKYPELREQ
jgi:hypothetical protein